MGKNRFCWLPTLCNSSLCCPMEQSSHLMSFLRLLRSCSDADFCEVMMWAKGVAECGFWSALQSTCTAWMAASADDTFGIGKLCGKNWLHHASTSSVGQHNDQWSSSSSALSGHLTIMGKHMAENEWLSGPVAGKRECSPLPPPQSVCSTPINVKFVSSTWMIS